MQHVNRQGYTAVCVCVCSKCPVPIYVFIYMYVYTSMHAGFESVYPTTNFLVIITRTISLLFKFLRQFEKSLNLCKFFFNQVL